MYLPSAHRGLCAPCVAQEAAAEVVEIAKQLNGAAASELQVDELIGERTAYT